MSKSDPTPLNGSGTSRASNDKLTAGKTSPTGQYDRAAPAAVFSGPDLARADGSTFSSAAESRLLDNIEECHGGGMSDDDPAELERVARGEAPVAGGGRA